jgi:hypothetical protein
MPGPGLILDIVIIVLLGATIFYAIRLSRYLESFRSNRAGMEHLIRELSMQITRAQEGVTSLEEASKESGTELRDLVIKSRELTEELALMNEAGNSLAERLEKLAVRNRTVVDELGSTAASLLYPGVKKTLPPKPSPMQPPQDLEVKSGLFSIRDPDFAPDLAPDFDHDEDISIAPSAADTSGLESQAERDLASALRRRRARDDT